MSIDGSLRKLFREHLPAFHWQSIETGGTGRGIPDSNYCYKGAEGWVEYKLARARAVNLSPEQIGWLLRRKRAGGRVFVAVRRKDELWLFDGGDAKLLRVEGINADRALYRGSGGPQRWGWGWVAAILTQ